MTKEQRKTEFLRKLIDLPRPIVSELQALARESNRSLKSYIEDLIVSDVRKKSGRGGMDDVSEGAESHNLQSATTL